MQTEQADSFRLTYRLHGKLKTVDFSRPRVVIGRGLDCDLVIGGPDVSRIHAAIERDPQGWLISDLDSRHGTLVNGQGVEKQRLAEGDQIMLGRAGPAGLVLTFHRVLAPAVLAGGVWFDDTSETTNIRLSINVEDFARSISGPPADVAGAEPGATARAEASTLGPAAPPEAGADETGMPRAGFSMVGLFKQIGEVLLTSDDLEEMLAKVVELALANLPAERGFICLCDETTETVTPKVTRVEGLAEGESITISHSIAREAIRARQALLVTDAPADSRFAKAPSVVVGGIRAAMCAPLYHADRVEGLLYVDTLCSDAEFVARDLELLTALGVLTAVGIMQARLRDDINQERAIRARLSRYSSPHVVEQIVAGAGTLAGEMLAEQREVTVLFADLSGFTPMVEGVEPAEVARVLNSVFELLTRAVFEYDGTLDKFLGDGLLAFFGAPLPQPDHADRAISAALQMQRLLEEGRVCGPQGERLRMRMGINSGTAVAGDIGSPLRKDYTVIGDVINVASRLESSVAKPGQIVIGPATYALSKDAFDCRALPEIRLKGKQEAVSAYLVAGRKPGAPAER